VGNMQCILNSEKVCSRLVITKKFEERPFCLSPSFECTASDCIVDKELR